jgi:hypothetical protein
MSEIEWIRTSDAAAGADVSAAANTTKTEKFMVLLAHPVREVQNNYYL